MTDEISKKLEGSPVELGKEELETIAGGVNALATFYQAVCSGCNWQATFDTRVKANAAATAHMQNYPGHTVKLLACLSQEFGS